MKSSNVLLTLFFLIVAGLTFGVVYLVLQNRQQAEVAPPAPVTIDPAKTPVKKDPRSGTRAATVKQRPPRVVPEIRGRVLDAEGKPLAGVAVMALPPAKNVPPPPPAASLEEIRRVGLLVEIPIEDLDSPRPLSAWAEIPASGASRGEGEPIVTTASDAEGRFVLTLKGQQPGAIVRVLARSETLGSASRPDVKSGEMNLDLVIATAGVVTGSVVDEATGSAVPQSRVAFSSPDREWTAVADEDGAFRIEDMPAGRYTVRAGAAGHVPILDQVVTVSRGEPVALKLPRGVTLLVRAVQLDPDGGPQRIEDGRPVANAEIVAVDENTYAYVLGRTDTNGLVEFRGLPFGSWNVNGRAEGVVPVGDERAVLRQGDAAQEVMVEFEPAVLTTIDVVDDEGQPVAGMEFFAGDPDAQYHVVHSEKLPGQSDARGRYQFAFEFMGRRERIFGFKKGFAAVSVMPDEIDEPSTVRVVAHKAVKVHGTVKTPEGQAVPGAAVLVTVTPPTESSDLMDDAVFRVVAGPDGRWEFPFVPAGWPTNLTAETADGSYLSDEDEDIEPKSDTEVNFTIELSPKVTALTMPGRPVPPPPPLDRK